MEEQEEKRMCGHFRVRPNGCGTKRAAPGERQERARDSAGAGHPRWGHTSTGRITARPSCAVGHDSVKSDAAAGGQACDAPLARRRRRWPPEQRPRAQLRSAAPQPVCRGPRCEPPPPFTRAICSSCHARASAAITTPWGPARLSFRALQCVVAGWARAAIHSMTRGCSTRLSKGYNLSSVT